jgi:midasin (ATPase involved in ribosome maturation)
MVVNENASTDIPEEERVDKSVPKITEIAGKRVDVVPEFPVYYEEFLVPEDMPEYIERGNEIEILNRIIDRPNPQNLMLYGPSGTGKTMLAQWVAKQLGMSCIQADMSEDMRRSNVIGGLKTTEENGVMVTKWKQGFAGEAIECANQNPNGCILVLEEGNQPRGEIQKLVNGLLDYRRAVYVSELGKYLRLKKGAKLMVIMTLNPAGDGYSGNEVEKSVKDRFKLQWEWTYPTITEMRKIMANDMKEIPKKFVTNMFKLVLEIQNANKSEELSDMISPRQLSGTFEAYRTFKGMENFEQFVLDTTVVSRFADDEQDLVKSRMESIFSAEAIRKKADASEGMTDE